MVPLAAVAEGWAVAARDAVIVVTVVVALGAPSALRGTLKGARVAGLGRRTKDLEREL